MVRKKLALFLAKELKIVRYRVQNAISRPVTNAACQKFPNPFGLVRGRETSQSEYLKFVGYVSSFYCLHFLPGEQPD